LNRYYIISSSYRIASSLQHRLRDNRRYVTIVTLSLQS